ncbi:KxYKxGKxW signal peptide domain-containing protein [uncultured Fructobacillus sp.]|uniref:KxYKxGKxW signal peptide domain-containing protein n=1 Tax=uncultured Fructobacillus sp. TaxID=591942 RepID=UPI0025965BF7|nr:KxYKxGKxW signal peptide domain-containing protein [uncultured Fructobacillus sp.]
MLNYHENIITKQHYKMYKAGKNWLFAAITAFTLGAGAFAAAPMLNVNTTRVEADLQSYPEPGWKENADSRNKGYVYYQIPFDSSYVSPTQSQVEHFDSDLDGTIGKWTDLPWISRAAVASGVDESVDVQLRNVYVRRIKGQVTYTIVPNQTLLYVRPLAASGRNNSIQPLFNGVNPVKVQYTPNAGVYGQVIVLPVPGNTQDMGNKNSLSVAFEPSWRSWGSWGSDFPKYTFKNFFVLKTLQQVNDQRAADIKSAITSLGGFGPVTAEQKRVNALIDQDPTLTISERALQQARITSAVSNAEQNISTAQSTADYNKAKDAGIKAINAFYQPGVSLPDQRQAVKGAIQAKASLTSNQIGTDPTLLQSEKYQETSAVSAAVNALFAKIDAASDADGINKLAVDSSIESQIVKGWTPGNPISQQQTAAVGHINTNVQTAIDQINQDLTLESGQKQNQVAQVNAAKQAALDAITTAVTGNTFQTADLIAAQVKASTAWNSLHTVGKSIPDRQGAANAEISDLASDVKQKIDQDVSLNNAEKAQEKRNVDVAAGIILGNITKAQTADAIILAKSNEADRAEVANAYQPAKITLPDQKNNAKKQIIQWVTQVTATINADPTLVQDDQNRQISSLNALAKQMNQDIDNQVDAQHLLDLMATEQAKLQAVYESGMALADRIASAQAQIKSEGQKISGQIQNDVTILEVSRTQQLKNVAQYVANVTTSISQQPNAEGVKQALAQAIRNIDLVYTPGTSLTSQQRQASDQLAQKAANTQTAIAADVALTQAQQTYQKGLIDQIVTAAQAQIAQQQTSQTIWDTEEQAEQNVVAQYEPSANIQAAQQAALSALDQANQQTTSKIQTEPTLSQAEKDQELGDLAATYSSVQKFIQGALTAASATAAGQTGSSNLLAVFHTGMAVSDRQNVAKADLNQNLSDTNTAIRQDVTLTNATKQQQQKTAQDAYNQALIALAAAKAAQDILDQTATGNSNIAGAHVSGSSLTSQRQAVQALLDGENNQVAGAINMDGSLTTADKSAQANNLAAAYQQASQALSAAQDGQATLDAKTTGLANIDRTHTAGVGVDQQRKTAQSALDLENTRVQGLINNDKTLLNSEKQAELAQLQAAYLQAQTGLDQAQDAQGILDVKTTGINSLAPNYTTGQSLADQQREASDVLTTAQKTVTNAISNDGTLLNTQKSDQQQAALMAQENGQTAISQATDAQGIADAKANALVLINQAHQPQTDITSQRQSVLDALRAKNGQVFSDIQRDVTLLDSEKQNQEGNLAKAYQAGQVALAANQAPDAQSILDARNAAIEKIDGSHVPGTDLSSQLQAAISSLQDKHTYTIQAIRADKTLTTADQTLQVDNADTAFQTAQSAVNADANAQILADDLATGLTNIAATHQVGQAVANQQQAAMSVLQSFAKQAVTAINTDATLLTSQQQSQVSQVNQVLANAEATIQADDNAQVIQNDQVMAASQINAVHTSGQTLDQQQASALAQLEKTNNQVLAAITGDVTLTDTVSTQQKSALATAYTSAQYQIRQATNAQAVADQLAQQTTNLPASHQASDTIANQIATAQSNLKAVQDGLESDIQGDVTLLDVEKASQWAQVQSDYKKDQASLAKLTTAQAILDQFNQAKDQLKSDHVAGVALDKQQSNAVAALTSQAKQTTADIAADATLTTATQIAQGQAVDQSNDTYATLIDQATTAQAVADQKATGLAAIKADHQVGEAVSTQAQAAIAALTKLASQIVTAISLDATLTDSQEASQRALVQTDLQEAQGKLQGAQTAQAVADLQNQYQEQLNADHQSASSLSDQLLQAQTALSDYASGLQGEISSDPTLLASEQTTQTEAVTAALAQKKIDLATAATSAQALQDVLAQAEKNLDRLHQPGLDLPTQIANASQTLTGVVKSINQAITNDVTLTESARQTQRDAVTQLVALAQTDFNSETTAQQLADRLAQVNNDVANAHQAAQPLPDQKKTALGQLQSTYQETQKAINSDVTLTNTVKASQLTTLDSNYSLGQTEINNATSAQLVSDMQFSWSQKLNNSHVVGKDLDSQRVDAKTAIKTQYTTTLTALSNDKTLLTADNQTQTTNVNNAYDQAVASLAVNQTVDAQSIQDAVAAGKAAIQAAYMPGTSLADQQKGATGVVNQAAEAVIIEISDDETLTVSAVATQSRAVTDAANVLLKKITTTTDAQTIANTITNVQSVLSALHTAGQPVNSQQKAANAAVNGAGDSTNQAINGDATLSEAEKAAQKAAVAQIIQAAISKINVGTKAAQIEADKNQAIQDITAAHQRGQAISNQQAAAITVLQAEVMKVKGLIENDGTLPEAERTSQKAAVDDDYNLAEAAVNKAQTADDINTAQVNGINSIDADYKAGDDIALQKQAAVESLRDEAQKVQAAVQSDPTLDTATINNQITALQAARDAAITKINASDTQTADQIDTAKNDGVTAIDNSHVVGTDLLTQVQNGLNQLQASNAAVTYAIHTDKTLTNVTKQTQKQNLATAYQDGQTNVKKAVNAQQIKDAVTNALSAMDQTYVEGNSVDNQRANALNKLQNLAQGFKALINIDPTLTNADKQSQAQDLAQAVTVAQTSLSTQNTPDAQSIADALSQANQNLAVTHKSSTSISDRITDAKSQLDQELQTINGVIEGDATLLTTEKAAQKSAAQDAHESAVASFVSSFLMDAQTVQDRLNVGLKAVDAAHTSGTDLATQQKRAIDELTQTAKNTKQDITSDNTLLEVERTRQRGLIDQSLVDAANALQAVKNADSIQSLQNQYDPQIAADHQIGTPLADQQTSAKNDLGQYAGSDSNQTGVWLAIDRDQTLTNAQKANQKADLATTLASYQDKAIVTPDAQSLADLVAKAHNALDVTHIVMSTLADQRVTANKQLAVQLAQTKGQIAAEVTLTTEQAAEQTKAAVATLATVQTNLANATDAQAILDVTTAGLQSISQQFQPGQALSGQINDAREAIQDAVVVTKVAIDIDKTLNTVDKAKQDQAVDATLTGVDDDLAKASNAQAILDLKNKTIAAVNDVYQAGAAISAQQQKANNSLAITANQVLQAISNDPNLTNAQRVSQQQAVTTALSSAQAAINALSDAQSILDAQVQQTMTIQDQHVLQPSVQAQQATVRQNFQDEHDQIRQEIVDDQTLTTADRNSQLAAVDQALTTANNLLTNTVNAQDVLDSQTQGLKGIDASDVPGLSLDAQVQNAVKTLTDLQDSLTAAVMNDSNLLDRSKSARELLLSSSLSKCTDKLNDALADSKTTGQTILDLLTAGQQELQKDRQSDDGQGASTDQPLATQITAALQQVNQKSQNVQNNINQDDSLSQAQIDQQTAANQQLLQQAQTDLNGKTNAQALADHLQAALSDLNQIHVPNSVSLVDQKSTAVANLDKLYGQIKDAITADNTLTSSQKDQQIADLDHAKAQGDDKLKQSTRATELNQQIEPINQVLSAIHVVGTAVDSQRQSQETWLANQIQALTDRLAAQAVSSADATTLQETIRQTKDSLQGQIEQAANADDLQSVQTNGLSILAGVALQIQQAQVRFAINQTADQQVVAINQDASLTKAGQGGQDDQVQQVNDARASILAQIDAATAANQLTALQNTGLTTLTLIHQQAAKSVDQQRQGAADQAQNAVKAVMNAIATAKDKGQVTADQASALTVALAKAQEKASQSLTSATTADQINAIIDQLNQDVAGVQLSLQQDVSANSVNQSAQQVVAAISQDATLADNEKQVQQANVSAQQQAALQQITSATTVTDAQSAETTFDQTVATNHVQGQSIDDRRSQLIEAITTATNQATMAINGDPSLTTAAKADQLNQLSQAKDAALAQLAKATTAADGVNFVNQSLTIIAAIHQPAEKTLSQQHQDLLDLITQLANQAAAKIDQEKSLTNSETASLKGQVTALQNAAVQSANESQNADDLQAGQQALQDGLDQVKFMTQQDANLHALNQAQLDANQVIANNQTLSDVEKANQNIQVMLLFTQYQQALLVAQNLASLASAVNNGIKAVAGVPQDGATVQQRVGNYIDRLTVEKKKVQSRIDADNTLTTADKNQQKVQVDQVLADETVVIQGAVSVQDGVDKTSQALQKIDAVYQAGPSLLTQQVAVRNTAANDLNTVNSAIIGDNTLSTDEISNLDGLTEQYKANFVTAVQVAQSADEMNQALTDFHTNLIKISNQHLKYNLVHQLQHSAMDTTAAIDNDPTLSASAEQEQLVAVQTALNQATSAISAVEIDDDQAQAKLASALSTGIQQIDASYQPGPAVSSHADEWQNAVTGAANQAKDEINADPTLTTSDRSRQVASIQQTLANTLAALQDVATVQAGDTIVTSSQKVLSAIHVAGLAVADRQNIASTTIQDVINVEQQKINQNASQLQPSDQSALTDQVTAANNAATAAINSAQSADEINQAVADLNQKLAVIDLDLAHLVGQFQLAKANELIQAAIDGDVTLLSDAKATQQANRLVALRKTTADLAATTTIASAQQSASDGVAVIQAAH